MRGIIRKRLGLTVSLVLFIFAVLLAALLLSGLLIFILHLAGALDFSRTGRPGNMIGSAHFRGVFAMMVFSTFLGTALAWFFSKRALNPIRKVIDATRKVARGDFDVRLDIRSIYELEELSHSFNKMVQELSTIETLRSDFVNNLSHEFKTPIVSMRGFAKLLKDESLSFDERQEYLDIIITESERLSKLSTNVLNLSKYESIGIITDIAPFRLDEQIRRAVLMSEPEWSAKNITLNVEMDEIVYNGNEDLTQQIWLNLIDNAIKFSHANDTISIRLNEWNGGVRFSIKDEGIGVDAGIIDMIFDKFYQGETQCKEMGNGLGLAIAKRITELCDGRLEVASESGKGSTFTVLLSSPGNPVMC